MKNNQHKGFLRYVIKVDSIDIVLKYKSEEVYNRKNFFIQKKRYTLDFYTICNSNKRIIYIFTSWPNSQYDIQI